ncbi:MAG: glycoside hydrolase 43 family protein [Luteolibacter sp.]
MRISAFLSASLVAAGFVLAEPACNPILYADVPDLSMIRVGGSYYMSSTTMHMSRGLPIMKSEDLVNWRLTGYAYQTLADNDALNLQNGRNAYGRGSWASSLRFHKGTYYVSTFSASSGRTHVYSTKDIEKGQWKENSFSPALHDHSMFFDDDGKVYMLHGSGDLTLTELADDVSGIKTGGFNGVVIHDATAVAGPNKGLPAEGSQLFKVNGKYYVFNITWPKGGMRTVLIHRADKITGPYEGRIALQDQGVAQGGLIDTPDGKWWAYLFQDHGAVGRIPYLVPVKWEDGWPVLGVNGKVPEALDLPDAKLGVSGIVASDEFNDRKLPLAWQWNHNPDNALWSLTKRPGALRLTAGAVVSDLLTARNTLTQRTFGPESWATTVLDTSLMQDGDCAGLVALQKNYGFVGVKVTGDEKTLVMTGAGNGIGAEEESVPFSGKAVHLRVHCDFRDKTDMADFQYSLDGIKWNKIGKTWKMNYTLPHFMGYRFGLFNFATRSAGGSADFDWFRLSEKVPHD